MNPRLRNILLGLLPPALVAAKRRYLPPPAPPSASPSAAELAHARLNADIPPGEIVVRARCRLALHPESRLPFEAFCFHRPEMVEEMDAFVAACPSYRRFLDIGALHGVFSLVFSRLSPEGHSLAIDPSPLAFSKLLYNLHVNPWASVDAVECALSDGEGALAMQFEWEHAVAHTVDNTVRASIQVRRRLGDSICMEKNFVPDLVKIDVEGHEIKVLRGLRHTLASAGPTIFLELHPDRIALEGDSLTELRTLLEPLGYAAATSDGAPFDFSRLDILICDTRLILTRFGTAPTPLK